MACAMGCQSSYELLYGTTYGLPRGMSHRMPHIYRTSYGLPRRLFYRMLNVPWTVTSTIWAVLWDVPRDTTHPVGCPIGCLMRWIIDAYRIIGSPMVWAIECTASHGLICGTDYGESHRKALRMPVNSWDRPWSMIHPVWGVP